MPASRIESLEIKNYRLFRHLELKKIPQLAVIIGANGTGKSTLFDVFTFLKDALNQNVAVAVTRRGGFRELVSRGTQKPIEFTVKFRETSGRLVTYFLAISSENGRAIVEREFLQYRRGQRGQPWRFLDFQKGRGQAITNESAYGEKGAVEERGEFALDDPSVLAIKGLGQFREFQVISQFRNLIESWHISDFHIAEAKTSTDVGYSEHLSLHGNNIAQVAQFLFENHRDCFEKVLCAMRKRVPGVSDVEAKATEDGRLVLRFQDGSFEDPFVARYVSDGTIKMFAYLVMLYHPNLHPLLAVEEPENQLYPKLLPELTEEFRNYARHGGQVFVSTHSPDFLNFVEPGEIIWLVKKDGFSTAGLATDDKNVESLIAEGDKPGDLWKQGLLFEDLGIQ